MPGFNGTGPMGRGPLTGRGMGYCAVQLPSSRTEPGPERKLGPTPSTQRSFYPYQRESPGSLPMGPMMLGGPSARIRIGRGFQYGMARRQWSFRFGG